MSCRAPAAVLAILLGLFGAACRKAEMPGGGAGSAGRRYPIAGVLRAVDADKSELTLEHGPVEGLMGGMTMPFPVRAEPAVLSRLRVGDRIAATLVVEGDRFWLERVTGEPSPSASLPPASATPLPAAGVATPRPNRGVAVGDAIPDFSLTDPSGHAVRLSQLRGQPVAVTFLYTRCPVATACPLTTARFSRLQAMLEQKGFGVLLTITVDPEHDTPPILADYARKASADPRRWKFLTGEPHAVADVAERFGVLYYPDHGQVVHTQAVAVVDPQGKLASIYYGQDWEPEHIFRDMEKVRKG